MTQAPQWGDQAWWVAIERLSSPTVAVGPFASFELANDALKGTPSSQAVAALTIRGLVEDDCFEAYVLSTHPNDVEFVRIENGGRT